MGSGLEPGQPMERSRFEVRATGREEVEAEAEGPTRMEGCRIGHARCA